MKRILLIILFACFLVFPAESFACVDKVTATPLEKAIAVGNTAIFTVTGSCNHQPQPGSWSYVGANLPNGVTLVSTGGSGNSRTVTVKGDTPGEYKLTFQMHVTHDATNKDADKTVTSNTVTLYVVGIGVKIQKEWIGAWGNPINNNGKYPNDYHNTQKQGRQWYVLWDCHTNAIFPEITPTSFRSRINNDNVTWSSLSTDKGDTIYTDRLLIFPDGDPLWRRIKNTQNVLEDVAPTVTFKYNDGTTTPITGTTKVDIVVTGVDGVLCITRPVPDPVLGPPHLARLVKDANGEGYRIYPQKTDPTSPEFDVTRITTSLTQEIPVDMSAYLYCYIMDNENPRTGAVITAGPNNGDDGVGMILSEEMVTFDAQIRNNIPDFDETVNNANVEMLEDAQALISYMQKRNKLQGLNGMVNDADVEMMSDEQKLAFYRQMRSTIKHFYGTVSRANAGNDFVVVAHPEPDLTIVIDNTFKAKVNSTEDLAPKEPERYQTKLLTVWRTLNVERDVATWQGMPAGDLRAPLNGFVATELARACVETWEFYPNLTPGPPINVTINNAEASAALSKGRDISGNNKNFWTVRIVTMSKNGTRGGAFLPGTNGIAVYYAGMKDMVETWNNPPFPLPPRPPADQVELIPSLRRNVLHEIGHVLINGDHQPDGIMQTGLGLKARLAPDKIRFLDTDIHKLQEFSRARN